MKKLKWMALIAVGWTGLACEKAKVIEEPKVENSVEATYLGVGCGYGHFMLQDTLKVKGTYPKVWVSTTSRFAEIISHTEKITKPPHRVVIGLFIDDKWRDLKLVEDKSYFFEFRKTNIGEKALKATGSCYPYPYKYEQIVILDTLTSKFTKYK